MFYALGLFIYRRRWAVLICTGVLLGASIASLVAGGRLTGGMVKNLESETAERLVDQVTGHGRDTTFIAIFESKTLAPSTQEFQDALAAALAPLRSDPSVHRVEAPQPLRSDPRRAALALITVKGSFKEALALYPVVRSALKSDVLDISCTGRLPFTTGLDAQLEHDLVIAELVSLPLALLVLLLVFRTVVAASLPAGVGGLAVAAGVGVVLVLSRGVDIAQYTINVCSLIGLGVAIDYSLFTVARYREELASGRSYAEALAHGIDHSGRVVAFSALAVVAGLSGLLFFEGSFLMNMGIGGTLVVAFAALYALTFLPALLAVLGPTIHRLKLPLPSPAGGAFWSKTAALVMRHPVKVLVPTLAVLLAMASPLLHLRLAASDVRTLPPTVEARRGFEALQRTFPDEADAHFDVAVVFPAPEGLTAERVGALYDLSARLAAVPGIRAVRGPAWRKDLSRETVQQLFMSPPPMAKAQVDAAKAAFVRGNIVFVQAISSEPPDSELSRSAVKAIRAQRWVADGVLWVGGESAADVDLTTYIVERAPRAVGFVVAATLVVLFLLLGSVLLPFKAVLMNALSIGGAFGSLVWLFQEGHMPGVRAAPLEPSLPVLLFCVLFGLSMDYEVLILTRMKEVWHRTDDNETAVGEGLQKTAGLVTSAAAIMVAVFLAFALAKVVLIQAVGVGMAVAVTLDATLVRVLLVPSAMRLFGEANWWAPKWLRSVRAALGLHDGQPPPPSPPAEKPQLSGLLKKAR